MIENQLESEKVISSIEQLELNWFELALQRSGAILTGGVESFEVQPRNSENSAIWHIRLTYRPGSTGDLPDRLLLKLCGGLYSHDFGPSEVYYYTRDYAGLSQAPLVKCYSAVYSATQHCYHLLLDDLSSTHHNNWERVDEVVYLLPLASALAKLHAFHWSCQSITSPTEPFPDAHRLNRFFAYVDQGLLPMTSGIKDEIEPAQIAGIEREYQSLPARLLSRMGDRQGFTLVHGDVNPGNILVPRTGSGPVYLIDRQPFDWSLTIWLALSDLAYTLVLWRDPENRRKLEEPVLRRYYESLLEEGISGYSWSQLVEDYNLCVAFQFWVPVEWNVQAADRERMRWLWLEQLKRVLAAINEPLKP